MYKQIVLATNNRHKLQEYRDMLSPLGYTVYCPADLNVLVDPAETGKDYFENSYIKAKAVAELVPYPVISDDSGFEIKGLNGFPGLVSARFADQFGKDYLKAGAALNERLGDGDRSSEFHCVICYLANSTAKPLYFHGICKGTLRKTPAGDNGFGYDPYFHCDENDKDFGTCSEEEKNLVSHRGKALSKFLVFMAI